MHIYRLEWPKFNLHFLIFSLTQKFCSFWSNNGPREGPGKNIFSDRSTNLKIEKSRFFRIFATLTPYFISFPDIQWAYKIITDNINIKWFFFSFFIINQPRERLKLAIVYFDTRGQNYFLGTLAKTGGWRTASMKMQHETTRG